jgi:dethiobiotin synthetase
VTAVFITSTGTDIGKTFVTAGLIAHLRKTGRSVEAIKPVVTGFAPATAAASDPGVLLSALGRPVAEAEIAKISPWRFRAPLSPDLAAARERRTLDFDALVAFSRQAVTSDVLLIEGVGGIMVPLDDRHTVLDWMGALGLPLVLVAGSYLGTISHTLSAVDVLQRRNLQIAAIVVSESTNSPVALDDTVASIGRFVQPIPVCALPRLPSWTTGHAVFDELATLIWQSADR